MGSKSPSTPDYTGAAQAQGAANMQAAQQQSLLNNPNMVTPYGNQTYSEGAQTGVDANGIPIYGRPTLTQTLSPAQQQLLNQGNQIKSGALGILQQDMPNISNALLGPFGFNRPITYGGYMPGTGPTAAMQYGTGNTNPIQGSVANPANFIPNVEAAQYAQGAMLLDPQFAQAQSDLNTQLANQGISMPTAAAQNTPGAGQTAWDRAQQNLGTQRTAAYQNLINNAITGGQQAAQQMFGENLAGGQFANQAQQQQFSQLLNSMQARNAAIGQQAQIASNMTGLANQAQQQGYTQYATNRTMPINMLTAMLSSGQVQNPTFQATQPTSIAAAPVLQGANLQGQQVAANSSANAGKFGSGLGAIGQIGAAAAPLLLA